MHHIGFPGRMELDEIAHGFGKQEIVERKAPDDIGVAYKQKIIVLADRRFGAGAVKNGPGPVDGLEKAGGGNGLHDIVGHRQLKSFYCVFFFGGGENNDGRLINEAPGQLDTGHAGHFDIEQEDVDRVFLQEIIGIERIGAVARHRQVFYLAGQLFDGGAGHFVIVDDEAGHSVKIGGIYQIK